MTNDPYQSPMIEQFRYARRDKPTIRFFSGPDFGLTALGVFKDSLDIVEQEFHCTPTVMFPTGGTPQAFYRELTADSHFKWRCTLNVVQLDEYVDPETELVISKTDPRSYADELARTVYEPLRIAPRLRTTFRDNVDPKEACVSMNIALAKNCRRIDTGLYGIGPNGHLGFVEPSYKWMTEGAFVSKLAKETREANAQYCEEHGGMPTHAVTQSLGLLTKRIVRHPMVLAKENKADILLRSLRGKPTPRVPASILQDVPNVSMIVTAELLEILKTELPIKQEAYNRMEHTRHFAYIH